LRKIAARRDFLLVADSKLVSYPNITALLDAKVDFVAPIPAAQVKAEVYAALDVETAELVDYAGDRDRERDTPADQRESYRVLEDVHVMAGPRRRDPVHRLRRILVHSTGNAKGQQAARAKRLARAGEDLEKLQRLAGGRYYDTAAKVEARIGVIAKTRRVTSCLRTTVTCDGDGRPSLGQAGTQSPPRTVGRSHGSPISSAADQQPIRRDSLRGAVPRSLQKSHTQLRQPRRQRGRAPLVHGPTSRARLDEAQVGSSGISRGSRVGDA
jgi:hypothetical protein